MGGWYILHGDPAYVLAEAVTEEEAKLMTSVARRPVSLDEMRAEYPEALRDWESKDTRSYARAEAVSFLVGRMGVEAADGLLNLRLAANLIQAHGIEDESRLFSVLARHQDALEEIAAVMRAEEEAAEAVAERKAS